MPRRPGRDELTYKRTMKVLWSFIGKESVVTLVMNGRTVASFGVEFLEPPMIPKLPWSRAKNLPAPGPPDHAISVDEASFRGAGYLHDGAVLKIELANDVQLIVAVPDSLRS